MSNQILAQKHKLKMHSKTNMFRDQQTSYWGKGIACKSRTAAFSFFYKGAKKSTRQQHTFLLFTVVLNKVTQCIANHGKRGRHSSVQGGYSDRAISSQRLTRKRFQLEVKPLNRN